MRVALVHDYLNQYGGAERVLEALRMVAPIAPVYTLFYDARRTGYAFDSAVIRASFLQRLPLVSAHHRLFPFLMPMAAESLDLSFFDVVISDSASFAKGVITRHDAVHICYCHTPTRFLWGDSPRYLDEFPLPFGMKILAPLFLHQLRVWDREAARRVDYFIANSRCVARRIRHVYGREAEVIYPPVEVRRFALPARREAREYLLAVGRFLPYKRFDLTIRAAEMAGVPLVIVGDGPERQRLQRLAGVHTRIVPSVDDRVLARYYAGARALVFPQEEDFGIAAVEAMACGTPVIAYRGGGALETVVEGVTGTFVDEQSPEAFAQAIRSLNSGTMDPLRIREHAERFRVERFVSQLRALLSRVAVA